MVGLAGDKADKVGGAFLILLTDIRAYISEIRQTLNSNSAVEAVTSGCDVRAYRDFLSQEPSYCFESYVEIRTRFGDSFCWSVDLKLSSSGWKLDRHIGKRTKDGEERKGAFEEAVFISFDELRDGYVSLMSDFVNSARNYGFEGDTRQLL